MQNRLSLFVFGFALSLLAAGCSKKSSPTSPQTSTPPTFPTVTLKGPNTSSTDTYAVKTKTDIAGLNGTVASPEISLILSVTPVHNGNTWTWTLIEGAATITATATTQPDGSNLWTAKINGTIPGDTVTYNNWTAISGTSSADGKSGNFNTYNVNDTTVAGTAVWTTNSSGQLLATLSLFSQGVLTGKSIVTNNADGSGELDEYAGSTLVFKSTWVNAGSGTWWTYSNTGTQSGTWS
jgi:hypothetical protein